MANFVTLGHCWSNCRPVVRAIWNTVVVAQKKDRVPIPQDLADELLFRSDRTCCVCRLSNKPVQIHHINDDPSDNRSDNLAVLCVVCHNETQITGGFGRKLNAGQVTWYRNDWPAFVEARRTGGPVKFEAIGARLSAMDSGQILYDSANKIKGGSPRLDSILEHMQEAQRQTLANRDKYLTWLKELEALAA